MKLNLICEFFLKAIQFLFLGIINGLNYLFFITLFTAENYLFVLEFEKVKSGEITLEQFIELYILAMVLTGQMALLLFFVSSPTREFIKANWKKLNGSIKKTGYKIHAFFRNT